MIFQKKDFVSSSFYLFEKFKDDMPFACGKIGNCELICIYNYFICRHKNITPIQWAPDVVEEMYNNTGVFPQTEEARIEFVQEIVKSLPSIDALAWWSMFNLDFEARFIKKHSFNCELIDLQSLESFYSGSPWTQYLKDKRVLVISPFTETIKKQYKNRNKIWQDPRVLPNFDLVTINHQHSPGIDKPSKYSSWIEMINDIKEEMDNTKYDVLLIGAGASALPLISHAKLKGKKAVHLGGGLQLLFGIKGGRWDNGPVGKHFYNEFWARPSLSETPEKFKNIEGGCYW
jgi:hypothetical protein